MKPKTILSILKTGASVLFYFLLVVSILLAGSYVYKLYSSGPDRFIKIENGGFGNMFIDLNAETSKAPVVYSADHLVRYKPVSNVYTVEFEAKSALGYYYMVSTLVFLSLGLVLLWNFKKVFTEIQLPSPFKVSIINRLRLLAIVFIGSDVLYFIHYFILNSLIRHSVHTPRLALITETGSGILTGFIILIIMVIYRRAVEIDNENSLTV